MAETAPEHAFPAIAVSPASDVFHQEGISLRDWFAGQALAGILAGRGSFGVGKKEASAASFQYADAMLAERSK